jgi:GNAT superfamily N-acetyltransferase
MPKKSSRKAAFEFHPLSPDRWADLEALFGPRGACGGCWCMTWRLKRSEFETQKGDGNRRALKVIVESGAPPGILAYAGGKPIGWCAVAPRECYPALGRSRILQPIDEQTVWSVTCFFVAKEHRRQGVSVRLLRAAVNFVKTKGGTIVEGYPVQPSTESVPAAFAWVGLVETFARAKFKECARRSKTRPIMRYLIREKR